MNITCKHLRDDANLYSCIRSPLQIPQGLTPDGEGGLVAVGVGVGGFGTVAKNSWGERKHVIGQKPPQWVSGGQGGLGDDDGGGGDSWGGGDSEAAETVGAAETGY